MNKKIYIIIILLILIPVCYAYEFNKQHNRKSNPIQENIVNQTIKYDVDVKQITADYKELEELPAKFDLEDAIQSHYYVYMGGREYNKEVYTNFLINIEKGEKSFARVATTTIEGDVIIIDLNYDGSSITIKKDSTRDKFSSEEDRIITTAQYTHVGQITKDDKNYWVAYNNNIDEDSFVISQIN